VERLEREIDQLAVPLLFHGTGAQRRQSIERGGLQPKLAAIFAVTRAEEEDDWGLIVAFKAEDKESWEKDPQFPASFRRREPVPASEIVTTAILTYEEEDKAIQKLKQIAKMIGMKVE